MKEYCENTKLCRRFCILKHFDGIAKARDECSVLTKHECCDICLPLCKCIDCVDKVQNLEIPTGSETEEAEPESAFNIPDGFICKKTLKEKLYDYKDSLTPDVLLVGNDLSTGFSDEVIEQILKVCDVVNTVVSKRYHGQSRPLGGETGSLCVIFNPATEKYKARLTFAKLPFYKE